MSALKSRLVAPIILGLSSTSQTREAPVPPENIREDEPLFDVDWLDGDVSERLRQLLEASPDLGELFFKIDAIDRMIEGALRADETGDDGPTGAIVRRVEARLNAVVERLVEWGLSDDGPELDVEHLEAMISGLESMLQEVLDRWVLPTLYGDEPDE